MNFIEEAMSLEISTEEFYHSLIDNCDYNPEVKKLLVMLAADTKHHINELHHLNQVMGLESRDSDFFLKAKEIFHALQQKKQFGVCSLDQIRVYEHVQETLKKTIALYEDMITQTKDERQKEIITMILSEKNKHMFLLDNILELLLHPDQWVENGEFNHLDEF